MEKIQFPHWGDIVEYVEERVQDAALFTIPGEKKMDRVLDSLIKWLDEQIHPKSPIVEALTDVGLSILKGLLRSFVQDVYDRLHDAGEV